MTEDNEIQLKVPAVSVVLSAFFPGLGQMYNGDRLYKGLIIFFAFAAGSLFYLVPGIIVWLYGMYDAYKKADLIQRGEAEYMPADNRNIMLLVLIPLIVMLALLAITLYTVSLYYGSYETFVSCMAGYS